MNRRRNDSFAGVDALSGDWKNRFRSGKVGAVKSISKMRIAALFVPLLLCTARGFSASVDGFVTSVSSPSAFNIGVLQVAISRMAHCEVGDVPMSGTLPYYSKHYALGTRLYHSQKTASSSCPAMRIVTGSRVHIEGILKPDGSQFVASRLVVYRIDQQKTREDVALIEEEPSIEQKMEGWSGTLQVDGYSLNVLPSTSMIAASADTTLCHSIHQNTLIVDARVNSASHGINFSSSLLKPNTWVAYHAEDAGDGSYSASQLRFWPNKTSAKESKYLKRFTAKISTDNVTGSPYRIQLTHGNAIDILVDRFIQARVSKLGMELVPQYQKNLPDSDASKIHFQFYVVRPYRPALGSGLLDINGVLPVGGGDGGGDIYLNLSVLNDVGDVIALPSGMVLIPDRVLVSLQNDAQLEALLSDAVESLLQKQAFLAQHHWNGLYFIALWLRLNEETLRLGIRQMFLAGYDIREAPFAWTVAQGKPVKNPAVDSKHPDQETPWYAAYAFDYISKYYSDVDYSKLKRGEAEYAQFLDELRKADPDAFAEKK